MALSHRTSVPPRHRLGRANTPRPALHFILNPLTVQNMITARNPVPNLLDTRTAVLLLLAQCPHLCWRLQQASLNNSSISRLWNQSFRRLPRSQPATKGFYSLTRLFLTLPSTFRQFLIVNVARRETGTDRRDNPPSSSRCVAGRSLPHSP